MALAVGVGRAEVEVGEVGDDLLVATGDAVEVVLHPGGEGEVDQVGEVLLEQVDDGEGGERRDQGRPLLPHVAAVLDGVHDGRVGGGAADPELLEPLDQRRLGVARRRVGLVAVGHQLEDVEAIAFGQRGQLTSGVVAVVDLVEVLDVDEAEALVGDHRPGRGELGVAVLAAGRTEADRHRLARGVGHLRGDGALPDQLVDLGLGGGHLPGDVFGRAERIAGRADRLVGLLGVLDLLRVLAGRVRQVLLTEAAADLRAGGPQRGLRQRRAVGPHVGDVPVLVEALRRLHRHAR